MSKKTKTIVISLTFIAVVISSISVKQSFIRTLPLIISLFVMLFQAEANRYGYIAGGLNSLVYAWVYWKLGLYATALNALFISFPIQMLTFFNWNRHSYKNSTTFKKMSGKMRIIAAITFLVVWLGVFTALKLAGSQYAILDNSLSLFSIAVSILTMLAYIEYSYLWLATTAINICLNIQVLSNDPSYLPYLIFSIYSMWGVIIAYINIHKLYKTQQSEKDAE